MMFFNSVNVMMRLARIYDIEVRFLVLLEYPRMLHLIDERNGSLRMNNNSQNAVN